MQNRRILVIDDEASVRRFFHRSLTHLDFGVDLASSGAEGLHLYQNESYDAVLVDLKMPDMDGIEVLHQLKVLDEDVVAIIVTGYGTIKAAVQTMKAGAQDFLTKPVDVDVLEFTLERLIENRQKLQRLKHLEEQVVRQSSFEGLIGISPEMQGVFSIIRRVAESDTTVLIQGETGTGKELVAKAIHKLSGVEGFLPINCGALPDDILESELFGHVEGAFTGAIRRKFGLIEQASGGTLFLDEIEAMSPALQVKLLRAIQEREVLPVGADHPIPVNFRLITASNENLRDMIDAGSFRADLYYRLNVVCIDLPPLRRRPGDVTVLAHYFARTISENLGEACPEFSPETMMLLNTYHWPGNVRELQNAVEQALVLCDGASVGMELLPDYLIAGQMSQDTWDFAHVDLREARKLFEKKYIEKVLDRCDWVVADAARMAGVNRQYLYEKMKKLDISREQEATVS